jgi:hypothetical protein
MLAQHFAILFSFEEIVFSQTQIVCLASNRSHMILLTSFYACKTRIREMLSFQIFRFRALTSSFENILKIYHNFAHKHEISI